MWRSDLKHLETTLYTKDKVGTNESQQRSYVLNDK